jgi:hypothetical protein
VSNSSSSCCRRGTRLQRQHTCRHVLHAHQSSKSQARRVRQHTASSRWCSKHTIPTLQLQPLAYCLHKALTAHTLQAFLLLVLVVGLLAQEA